MPIITPKIGPPATINNFTTKIGPPGTIRGGGQSAVPSFPNMTPYRIPKTPAVPTFPSMKPTVPVQAPPGPGLEGAATGNISPNSVLSAMRSAYTPAISPTDVFSGYGSPSAFSSYAGFPSAFGGRPKAFR